MESNKIENMEDALTIAFKNPKSILSSKTDFIILIIGLIHIGKVGVKISKSFNNWNRI